MLRRRVSRRGTGLFKCFTEGQGMHIETFGGVRNQNDSILKNYTLQFHWPESRFKSFGEENRPNFSLEIQERFEISLNTLHPGIAHT